MTEGIRSNQVKATKTRRLKRIKKGEYHKKTTNNNNKMGREVAACPFPWRCRKAYIIGRYDAARKERI